MFFKKQTVSKWNKVLGFSIMEVMISMFVLSAGIVAVIQLFALGFINSAADRDRIVAAGLAQEGLEIVKNIRDNTLVIPGNLGFEGFAPIIAGSSGYSFCGLDYKSAVFTISSSANCFSSSASPETKFSLVPTGAGFTRSATSTKWARVVYIEYNHDPTDSINDNAEVTSIVWWGQSSSWPDILSGGKPTETSLKKCTAGVRCVYATMHLNTWKP